MEMGRSVLNCAVLVLFILCAGYSARMGMKKERDMSICNALEGSPIELLEAAQHGRRMVVVGDIHGAYDGLREILQEANVITSEGDKCEWKEQEEPGTILLQIGDVVDRGPGSLEAWRCLTDLVHNAPTHSEAVLILGNHDLWWLKGYFADRNEETDVKANIMEILQLMRKALFDGDMRGAYLHHIRGIDIIFTHAGFRPEMLTAIKGHVGANNFTTGNLVQFYNDKVAEHSNCSSLFCPFRDEMFDAGPDRGGHGIGGPLWTDFGVLEDAARRKRLPPNIIQVVGHSIADCFRRNGEVPMEESASCARGLVRATDSLHAICVDGGMFLGARAFLEITSSGSLLNHQQTLPSLSKGTATGKWVTTNIWDTVCSS